MPETTPRSIHDGCIKPRSAALAASGVGAWRSRRGPFQLLHQRLAGRQAGPLRDVPDRDGLVEVQDPTNVCTKESSVTNSIP